MRLQTEPRRPSRGLPIGLGLVAAGLLIYACVSDRWLVNFGDPEHPYGLGLRTTWQCSRANALVTGAACTSVPNADVVDMLRSAGTDNASAAFAPMGWTTFVLLAIGAVALVVASLLALARVRRELPVTPTTVALLALMFALISGCIFVATKPGPPGWVGSGLAFWAFGLGSVLGIVAAQQLARISRPPDPDLVSDLFPGGETHLPTST
jgi:hypothetical protein